MNYWSNVVHPRSSSRDLLIWESCIKTTAGGCTLVCGRLMPSAASCFAHRPGHDLRSAPRRRPEPTGWGGPLLSSAMAACWPSKAGLAPDLRTARWRPVLDGRLTRA